MFTAGGGKAAAAVVMVVVTAGSAEGGVGSREEGGAAVFSDDLEVSNGFSVDSPSPSASTYIHTYKQTNNTETAINVIFQTRFFFKSLYPASYIRTRNRWPHPMRTGGRLNPRALCQLIQLALVANPFPGNHRDTHLKVPEILEGSSFDPATRSPRKLREGGGGA